MFSTSKPNDQSRGPKWIGRNLLLAGAIELSIYLLTLLSLMLGRNNRVFEAISYAHYVSDKVGKFIASSIAERWEHVLHPIFMFTIQITLIFVLVVLYQVARNHFKGKETI